MQLTLTLNSVTLNRRMVKLTLQNRSGVSSYFPTGLNNIYVKSFLHQSKIKKEKYEDIICYNLLTSKLNDLTRPRAMNFFSSRKRFSSIPLVNDRRHHE